MQGSHVMLVGRLARWGLRCRVLLMHESLGYRRVSSVVIECYMLQSTAAVDCGA